MPNIPVPLQDMCCDPHGVRDFMKSLSDIVDAILEALPIIISPLCIKASYDKFCKRLLQECVKQCHNQPGQIDPPCQE